MRPRRLALRSAVLIYLAVILLAPLVMVVARTFAGGVLPVLRALLSPDTLKALALTLEVTAIAVPCNTVFGVLSALALSRPGLPARTLLGAVADLPLALSPVVVGFALFLLYGRTGWFGGLLAAHGLRVLFAPSGMVLATIFVTLPFVLREVLPVLRAAGPDQEEAAATLGATAWQAFWRVTFPRIRSAIAYGMVLTAAFSLGEYGAVSIVSGQIVGVTETMTIHVQLAYESFDMPGAYATALVLLLLAVLLLVSMQVLRPKEAAHVH